MNSTILRLAKVIYRGTPFRPLRNLLFQIYCMRVNNRVVQADIDGVRYQLDLGETIDLAVYLGQYEPEVRSALARLCRPGHTVLDIGANMGAHALPISKIVGDTGAVYAFEPTDYAFRKLQANLALNAGFRVTPVQVALSDAAADRQTVHFRSSWPTRGARKDGPSVVDFMRLDDWCRHEKVESVHMIKMDVDGNEYAVLHGAQSLLKSQKPPLVMEVWGLALADASRDPLALLDALGYKPFHIVTEEPCGSMGDLRKLVTNKGSLLDYSVSIIAR